MMAITLWGLLSCVAEPRFPDPVYDLLSRMDADRSQSLELAELRGDAAQRVMAIVDRDRSARLEVDELQGMMSRISSQRNLGEKSKGKHQMRGKAPLGPGPGPGSRPPGPDSPQVPGLR